MQRGVEWPLFGRGEELEVVADLIGDPSGRGLVIAGAAGTGKSRFALEASRLADETGWETVRVVASQAASTVPLGVFAPLLPFHRGDHARTFEGLNWASRALTEPAQGKRMMLVVDDAHHLDPASATLVHQMAVGDQPWIVAVVRTEERAPDAIMALWKDGLAYRLELQPLSHEETAGLLRVVLSGEIHLNASHELWSASGGNLLFLRELVWAAVEGKVLVNDRGVWALDGELQIPSSIEELVGQRLGGMTSEQREAMYTLAFGEALGLETLRALHPEAGLTALESRGFIHVQSDDRRRLVSLAHPMYGEVLRAHAPATSAIDVALRLTETVEKLGARRREDALRVATWRLVTGGESEPTLLGTAAQQAYHAGDIDLAERLARTALDGRFQPAVAVLLARILDERGEHTGAEEIVGLLEPSGLSPSLRKPAALARSDNLFFGLGDERKARQVLTDAQRTFRDGPDGELAANRAWIDLHAGKPRLAMENLAEIGSHDTQGLVAAGIVGAWALSLLGDSKGALRSAEESASREQEPAYPAVSRHQGFPKWTRGIALLHRGRLDEAEEIAKAGVDAAVMDGPIFLQARWMTLLAWVLSERGLMATAANTFRQAATLQRRLGQTGQLRANLAGQALAAAQNGVLADAEIAIEELDGLPDTPERLFDADVLSSRAWHAAALGERSTAFELLGEAGMTAREAELVAIEARVQHDLIRLGELDGPATRLATLADISDSSSCAARAQHAAAKVAGEGADLEAAATQFEEVGLWLLAAEAFGDAALVYARSGVRRANACQRQSEALLTRCEDPRPPSMTLQHPTVLLTPREREVVTMAASGMTSKAIAERLVISVRTVNNLIQHAYVKLGVHNRGEASQALGLDPDSPTAL